MAILNANFINGSGNGVISAADVLLQLDNQCFNNNLIFI